MLWKTLYPIVKQQNNNLWKVKSIQQIFLILVIRDKQTERKCFDSWESPLICFKIMINDFTQFVEKLKFVNYSSENEAQILEYFNSRPKLNLCKV